MSETSLTVTERAIIDLQRQREAIMARAKNFDPTAFAREVEKGDLHTTADRLDYLTRPVRLELTFRDPIAVRQQIEVLMGYLTDALVITQDHGRGINRQRVDLRNKMENARDELVLMNGRKPSGWQPTRKS